MLATHRKFDLTTGIKGSTIAVINDGAGNISVLYHKTLVVEKRGAKLLIRNGGWDTVSTRHVINTALREIPCKKGWYSLIRHKGQTLLGVAASPGGYPGHKNALPFIHMTSLRALT